MDVQHVAIVGLGSVGCKHLRVLRKLRPGLEITVVRSGLGKDYKELQLADRVVGGLEQALSVGIQAAILSSPAVCHVKQATFLMKAGVHLLIEKPLSNSSEGIDSLLELETNTAAVCLMGYVLRHDPCAGVFRKLLNDGRLGQHIHARIECASYLPEWRPDQSYKKSVSALAELGGGVLLELSHELDYIVWLLGDIRNVIGRMNKSGILGIEVEDSVDIILENSNGLPISVHLDFNRRSSTRSFTVYGEKGELVWNLLNGTIEWCEAGCSVAVEHTVTREDSAYLTQMQHFLDCIENNAIPFIELRDGYKVLRLIESIRISNETGQEVRVN